MLGCFGALWGIDVPAAACGPILTASGVVTGAIIAFVAALIGTTLGKHLDRRAEDRRREVRTRDIVLALYAEISAGRSSAAEFTAPEVIAGLRAIVDPFMPSDRSNFIFESVKSDISILPETVIYSVVLYYKWAERSDRLTDFLEQPRYKTLSRMRKTHYKDLIVLSGRLQRDAGVAALDSLQSYMRRAGIPLPDAGAEALGAWWYRLARPQDAPSPITRKGRSVPS